ncbi:MAG TPA: zinc-ribbon domain-containing protein, partial [Isosphaeraceae bacterium]|nr:zinc-ribbon domain-containing protein [Isosphaeraceae bacterium]
MQIQCPHCGRMGSLPDRLAAETSNLRCRRCSANFRIGAGSGAGVEPRLIREVAVPVTARGRAATPSSRGDGFFAGWDESEAARGPLGPGDSQYELTFRLADPGSETAVGWPESPGDEPFVDEGPSGEVVVPRVAAGAPPDPWSFRFFASSGRLLFYGGLGLAGLTLPLLGFLLARVLGDGAASSSTALALLVGTVVALAFLFLCLSL